jgi:glucose-1-phosphate thymidylyltransferase
MKGILLAGGLGTRLWPMTVSISKQLLPVYDKPTIYYPLSTLMEMGIRDILIISTPRDVEAIRMLLGTGADFGIELEYLVQPKPEGIAQALILGKDFLQGGECCLILGDNLFFNLDWDSLPKSTETSQDGAKILACEVKNPTDYGNIHFDSKGEIVELVEKPPVPFSSKAITGMYFLDGTASERAELLSPSKRGELEITDLLNAYLEEKKLEAIILGEASGWIDMGSISSINTASEYVREKQILTGKLVGSPHYVAQENNWITQQMLHNQLSGFSSQYAIALRDLILRDRAN